MVKKLLYYFLIISTVFCVSIFAEDNKNAKIERGFRFGDFNTTKEENLEKLNKNDIGKILLLILKEERKQSKESAKQTKLLTEIRDILQNEFDPKPKIITVNGKKCVENEDADCFRMPIINEVKRIPAIANAYKNQTLDNIKKRELWYAKYTQAILRDSYLKGQAIRELGPKYPLATRPIGSVDSMAGWDQPIRERHKKNLFLEHNKHFEYNLFLGINKGLDMFSLVPFAYLVRDNPEIKINLIFNSNESKEHWEKQYKNFFTAKYLKELDVYVQPEAFKEFKIYDTPSLYLKDKKNNKDTLLHIGRVTELDLINKTLAYMVENKFIEQKDFSARNFWNTKNSADYINRYFKDKLGIKYEK